MKAKIIIEQFNNGISLKWQGNEFFAAGQNIVVLEDYTEKELGKMIWKDVDFTMNKETCNKVEMTIEYKPVKTE